MIRHSSNDHLGVAFSLLQFPVEVGRDSQQKYSVELMLYLINL